MPKKNKVISDYKKIIQIQERIIKAKEKEFKLVEKLFFEYMDRKNSTLIGTPDTGLLLNF